MRRCVSCRTKPLILPIGTAIHIALVVVEGSAKAIKKATPWGGFCMSEVMVPVQVITVGWSMPVRCLISARSLIALIISARATWGSSLRSPLLGT